MATPHVVCVLGKALLDDGTPTMGLIERVEHGVQLFNEYRLNSLPCILLFSGGNGNPKANKPEADVMSQIAISKGVDPKHIFIENASKNSIETILNVRAIVDGKKFASLVVITSQYHLKRIEIMMEAIMEQRIEWYVIGIRGTTEAKVFFSIFHDS